MRTWIAVGWLCCSLAGCSPAALPVPSPLALRISGPQAAVSGELVVLAAEGEAPQRRWLGDVPHLVIDDGRRLVFATPKPGSYRFVLAASDAHDLAIVEHVVAISGPAPQRAPGPLPPNPQPAPGPQPLSLGTLVKQWVATVQSPAKIDEARRLSQSFEALAAQISAGVLTSPDLILKATAESNRVALGPARTAWNSFFESLRQELNRREAAGKIEYGAVWREIAAGLTEGIAAPAKNAERGVRSGAPVVQTPQASPVCPNGLCPLRPGAPPARR